MERRTAATVCTTTEGAEHVNQENIKAAEKVLVDNGIEADEAATVLQALGYALLDVELYPTCS